MIFPIIFPDHLLVPHTETINREEDMTNKLDTDV